MTQLTKVKDIIAGRSVITRRPTESSEKAFNIITLLSKQHEVLIAHKVGNFSGEQKVRQLIKYGFAKETSEGILEPTKTASDFLNDEVAYPIEAILDAQAMAETQLLYYSPHLKETLKSLGIDDAYLKWWQEISRISCIPGVGRLGKPHLEIPITGFSEQECLERLGLVKGYFFGKSIRKTSPNQFTLIIVSAS